MVSVKWITAAKFLRQIRFRNGDFWLAGIERKRAPRDVEGEKKTRGKVEHVKFCCSRCRNPSSRGDLIRGGPQSHSEKFISISRGKMRAVCLSLFPSPSLARSRHFRALSVCSAFRCQRAEGLNKKKGHSFRSFWRRWDANTTVSFSLLLSLSLSHSSSPYLPLFLFAWLWISAADN